MSNRLPRFAAMLAENLGYAFGTGKPRLLAKLVRNHLQARRGVLVPRSLCIAVDYRCNLVCQHCSARSLESHHRPTLTHDDFRSLAEQVEEMGFFNIQFTGGEPLLRKDLEEIVSYFHPRRNFMMISTNAILLDDRRARSLKSAGVDVLSVSLDSSDERVHDEFRGLDHAWRKAVEGIKAAQRAGLKVSCSAVITHQNIRSQDLEDLAGLFKSMGVGMQLNWACPVGAWAGNREARLTADDMDYLREFQQRHHHARTDFDGNYRHRGCPAVKEMMYISAHGDYMPCAFIPISYGNVKQEPLADIRNRALADPVYRKYWDSCLSACNDEFYEKYLVPTFDRPNPVPHTKLHEESPEVLKEDGVLCGV